MNPNDRNSIDPIVWLPETVFDLSEGRPPMESAQGKSEHSIVLLPTTIIDASDPSSPVADEPN